MAGLIGIGLSGVLGHQTALNTTANNITNANTPGYSRQEVQFETQDGRRTGAGTIGSGVSISNIRRLADAYLNQQLREDSTLFGEQNAFNAELTRLDNLLGGEDTGLNNALNNFFSALQNAAEDPTSLPQRQLVLSEAQQLVNRFQGLSQEFIQQRESVKTQMQQGVNDVNTLLKSIADLNLAISESPGVAQGKMPLELMDQRDEKLRQLSELVSIRVTEVEGSQVNVSLANGLSLVTGANASEFATRSSAQDPTRLEFTLTTGGRTLLVDEQIQGGKLGGLRAFDELALKPAFDELGRLAIAISSAMNHQHEIGMDLEGDLGGSFFTDVNALELQRSRVVPNGNNNRNTTGQLAVEITDSSLLPAGSWELQFSGDGRSYELIDSMTGETVRQGRLPDPVQSEINMPGFNIRVEGGEFNPGDKYLIQPGRNAADSMNLNIRREEDLAFASPIRTAANDSNLGTATINQGDMLNVRNPNTGALLDDFQGAGQFPDGPVTVTFSNDGAGNIGYVVSNDSGVLFDSTMVDNDGDGVADTYDPQKINQIFSSRPEDEANGQYRGYVFEMTGEPADGDVFTIDFNKNGVSDNRNAELLAGLGTKNTLNGGSQNFTEGYAGLVEDIGVKTRQSQMDKEASATLLEQSVNQRESMSGVNLDEEAGKLIQYQAAYNASAQVMSVAQDLFNTLLQSFR
ncbi:flagellar hook-associated protein FlgK [Marinobacter daepoensis]|uniref:Flagellar hook-associated protein 1 n=1 Tax=Marinobacter daepoensis TaxID=262077 RepID=A0ABS3BBN3_9GAMM|nr:flagellar hook-associated protein FlgK [Marinobacter daepoensis]MBN7769261.1 flagellar hook-associated protein FlgK [Marinobacter daepoensis]MBY6077951.1 flagellar hook-associated protein FlgK [Marinobacter daepoensis]